MHVHNSKKSLGFFEGICFVLFIFQVWDFETIDTADQTDESGLFEMDPMNELRVGQDVQLYGIVKSIDEENEPTIWYAQVKTV